MVLLLAIASRWTYLVEMPELADETIANSHIVGSHSVTPLFLSLALWQLTRGLVCKDRRSLALSAFLLALALQTNPWQPAP